MRAAVSRTIGMSLAAGSLLTTVACLINYVKHPARVQPGEIFDVEVKATDDDSHELTPTLCAGIPTGWEVQSGLFEGENQAGPVTGELVYSEMESTKVKTLYPDVDVWSCWIGHKDKHPAFKAGFGRMKIKVPDQAKGADYPLRWRVGSLENPEEATSKSTITVPYKIYVDEVMLPIAYETVYVSQPFVTHLAKGDVSWEHVDGNMPPGLSIGDGKLKGVPTEAGNYPFFVVRATDDAGHTADVELKMIVSAAPEIKTTTISKGKESLPYETSFESTGGSFEHVWRLVGEAPPGLVFSEEGRITGVPTQPGRWTLRVRVTDDKTAVDEAEFSLIIDPKPRVDTSEGQSEAWQTVDYEHVFSVPGEAKNLTWRLTSGTPPAGLAFADAKLFGTPKEPGTYEITVHAEDPEGAVTEQNFTLMVHSAPVIETLFLPPGRVTVPYTAKLEGRGGSGNLTFSMQDLPEGLKVLKDKLTGVPKKATVKTVTLRVEDERGAFSKKRVKIIVEAAPRIPPIAPVQSRMHVVLDHEIVGQGLTGAVRWVVSSETPLPPGITFEAGRLGGKPTTDGKWTVEVDAEDATGGEAHGSFSIVVAKPPSILTDAAPKAKVARRYDFQLTSEGATGVARWSVTGDLPLGLRLSNDTITGTPRQGGSYEFTVRVTDTDGSWSERDMSIDVSQSATDKGGFEFPIEQ
jgi:hypothetical protein